MIIGISKEEIASILEYFDKGNLSKDELVYQLYSRCKELDPWLPIENAPKGERGFLALGVDRDSIEWLSDIGEDKFYNNNSNNFTSRKHWSHYKLLPEDPK